MMGLMMIRDCMRWNAITRHKSWDPLIPAILSPGRLARLRNSSGDPVMIINTHVLLETNHVSLGWTLLDDLNSGLRPVEGWS